MGLPKWTFLVVSDSNMYLFWDLIYQRDMKTESVQKLRQFIESPIFGQQFNFIKKIYIIWQEGTDIKIQRSDRVVRSPCRLNKIL